MDTETTTNATGNDGGDALAPRVFFHSRAEMLAAALCTIFALLVAAALVMLGTRGWLSSPALWIVAGTAGAALYQFLPWWKQHCEETKIR